MRKDMMTALLIGAALGATGSFAAQSMPQELQPRRRRIQVTPAHPEQSEEIRAWNAAVEQRKAERLQRRNQRAFADATGAGS